MKPYSKALTTGQNILLPEGVRDYEILNMTGDVVVKPNVMPVYKGVTYDSTFTVKFNPTGTVYQNGYRPNSQGDYSGYEITAAVDCTVIFYVP